LPDEGRRRSRGMVPGFGAEEGFRAGGERVAAARAAREVVRRLWRKFRIEACSCDEGFCALCIRSRNCVRRKRKKS
jgi:hypothetical protein